MRPAARRPPVYSLKRALLLVVLCPALYVAGGLIAGAMPDGLDVTVLILFLTAAAACPVLLVLDLAHWAMGVPQRLRLDDRLRRGLCRSCGYDLTGNASGVCPECGTAAAR